MFPRPTVNNIMHMIVTSLFTYRICPHCIIPPTSTSCLTEKINITGPPPNTLAWTCSLLKVLLRSLEGIVMSWQRYEPDTLLNRFGGRLLRIQQKCASLLKKPFSYPPQTIKLFHSGTIGQWLKTNMMLHIIWTGWGRCSEVAPLPRWEASRSGRAEDFLPSHWASACDPEKWNQGTKYRVGWEDCCCHAQTFW